MSNKTLFTGMLADRGVDVTDSRQCVRITEAELQGYGPRFVRRFYIVRNPDTWLHDPELLEHDYNESDVFSLFWARRLADEDTLDSGLTVNSSNTSSEESSPDLASRPLTPDPRARGERSPALTTAQRRLWEDSTDMFATQVMPTVKPATVESLIDADTLMLPELPDPETIEPVPFDPDNVALALGDSMSDSYNKRVQDTLAGLYRPESPGPSGVKGEEIHPNVLGAQPFIYKSELSPDAPPFTPKKRLNSTSVSELYTRNQNAGQSSAEAMASVLSDSTLKEGDDGLTGLNLVELANQSGLGLSSSPSPPPRSGRRHSLAREPPKRSRMM